MTDKLGMAGRMAAAFVNSKLTPLTIVASLLLGIGAVILLPREEEPQIIVPMVDVFVQYPGATAKEVEQRVTTPMEKLIWEVPGVEYLYSTSQPGGSMVIVRFYVGQDVEESVFKIYNKLYANMDQVPPGVSQPLVKPRSIDNVPIVALTLWSEDYDGFLLRRVTAEVEQAVKSIPDVSETTIIGGEQRQFRVQLHPDRLAAYGITALQVQQSIQLANREDRTGNLAIVDKSFVASTGAFIMSPEELSNVVVGAANGRPVYLHNVATVVDGAGEPETYVQHGLGPSAVLDGLEPDGTGRLHSAVTLAVAKRKGTNAIVLSRQIMEKVEALKGSVIPDNIEVSITRDYGETSNEKSNELLFHMALATISVTLLIMFVLGRRESIIVAVAIPVTLALTLMVFYLYGYTLNRITLFALIFSIGILVDDAIVVVENIVRHIRLPENKGMGLRDMIIGAVAEVGNPTILATLTVVAAILPMAFVGGLMGPYMRPIPIGASAAMIFSLIVAFIVTPWSALRLFKGKVAGGHDAHDGHGGEAEGWSTRFYRWAMGHLLHSGRVRWAYLGGVVVLLLGSMALVNAKFVIVKMLPFDNKSEFQLIVNMPEGTTLETTAAVTQELAAYLATVPEVKDYQTYVGTSGPYNFNGLVRHYFLRTGPNVADIQVNLAAKHDREAQSHDVAKRERAALLAIAQQWGAKLEVAEVPPGPPVLQTLVAEVYGPDYDQQIEMARDVEALFKRTDGVVDVDTYVEDPQPKMVFLIDKEKAALHGISAAQITQTLQLAVQGASAGLAHLDREREDVNIMLRLPQAMRAQVDDILSMRVRSAQGNLVALSEVVDVRQDIQERAIYHKNLKPVVYVTGDVAGKEESPVYPILSMMDEMETYQGPDGKPVKQYTSELPFNTDTFGLKWDGEWHITYEVFRDMGLAFAAVMVLIYILIVAWFQSYITPLIIMAAIPFSLVGILPAHGMMGAYFTATSMIGFIAGAGIVVRNSIILVDFIELRLSHGDPLDQAVIEAGAVRFRPMLLTAAAVVVGASVILFDPIFQGLAIALMAGEVASLLLSRTTVPVLYYMFHRNREVKVSVAE
jgi:multidrug efflux pump subunit AcrB